MASDEIGVEEVVPTVTLARLYAKQGLLKEAAAVYRALLCVDPGQEALKEALRDIERRLGGQEPRTGSTEAETVLSQLERWQKAVWAKRNALGRQAERKPRVLVVLGPEVMSSVPDARKDSPGSPTPEDIEICIGRAAEESGMVVDLYRAVDDEALIRRLREATTKGGYDVLIVEPGQADCTAPAARDALTALDIPIIEVHFFNVFRGGLSPHHGIADVTTAHLAGFGKQGYAMAVRAAAQMARQQVV